MDEEAAGLASVAPCACVDAAGLWTTSPNSVPMAGVLWRMSLSEAHNSYLMKSDAKPGLLAIPSEGVA
jgi:hypothetical protein